MSLYNCRCGKGMLHEINDGFCVWCGYEAKTFSAARWRKILAVIGLVLEKEAA